MRNPEDAKKWWSTSVGRAAFNCADGTFRVEELLIYYDDGTYILKDAELFPTPWQPVPPDSGLSSDDPGQENRCREPGDLIALNEVPGVRYLGGLLNAARRFLNWRKVTRSRAGQLVQRCLRFPLSRTQLQPRRAPQ
jgi:hypothetical protein